MRKWLDDAGPAARFVHALHPVLNLDELFVRRESLGDPLGNVRDQHVVSVEKDDCITSALLEAGIERGRLPAVILEYRGDSCSIRLDYVPRLVCRAVVDDDDGHA